MEEFLEYLIDSATRAPSGDNTQPWRFIAQPADSQIIVQVDNSRDRSPMNAGGQMARIAVGAAIENILVAAAARGSSATLVDPPPNSIAAVQVESLRASTEETSGGELRRRLTNRREYDGRSIPTESRTALVAATPLLEGVSTNWIFDQSRLPAFGRLIGVADATMFGQPTMRNAFLEKVRFDEPPDAEVDEGLSLGSLELSRFDRIALRTMPYMPNWLLRAGGAMKFFQKHAESLVSSSSGLCLIVSAENSERADLAVGRCMERAWLALTRCQLACQPMMSLMVLQNVLENGDRDLVESVGRDAINRLSEGLRELAPEIGAGRVAFLMRFGFAEAPSGRTGRLPAAAAGGD